MVNSLSPNFGTISNYYNHGDSSSKIEVPVPSSVAVYAQFKYVRGVPASSAENPISLSRAQIIDNMVSYLNNNSSEFSLNRGREEFHVRELESEVHRVINDTPPMFSSFGSTPDTGVVFNLRA